jgi:hypothetical protein
MADLTRVTRMALGSFCEFDAALVTSDWLKKLNCQRPHPF